MKNTTLTIFLLFIAVNISFGQISDKYTELINEAMLLYKSKEYRKSGEKFSEAFKNKKDKVNELQTSLDALEETDITMELENHRKMTDINQQYQKIQGLESELSQLKTSSGRSEKQIKTLENNG